MGPWLGIGEMDSAESLADQILHELMVVSKFVGAGRDDRGCMEDPIADCCDDEQETLRQAERLVYGWPSKDAGPTYAVSRGRHTLWIFQWELQFFTMNAHTRSRWLSGFSICSDIILVILTGDCVASGWSGRWSTLCYYLKLGRRALGYIVVCCVVLGWA